MIHKPDSLTLRRLGAVTKELGEATQAEGSDIKDYIREAMGMKHPLICIHPLLDDNRVYNKFCKVLNIQNIITE